MKKFDRSINGYNIYQVNSFVDEVVEEVDQMVDKIKRQSLEIDRLEKELEHYKKMDETLNKAVAIAESSATTMKDSSRTESETIIENAKCNANRIINDALLKAESIEEESQRIRRNIILYKRRMKNLIDQQSEIIDDLDKVDIQ